MKIIVLIARVLLGLIFFVFGLNGFFMFMKGPIPTGDAGAFLNATMHSHYIWLIAGAQALSGFLILINRFVALALIIAAALIANILTYHVTMLPDQIGMAIGVTVLWAILALRHRAALAPLFAAKAD